MPMRVTCSISLVADNHWTQGNGHIHVHMQHASLIQHKTKDCNTASCFGQSSALPVEQSTWLWWTGSSATSRSDGTFTLAAVLPFAAANLGGGGSSSSSSRSRSSRSMWRSAELWGTERRSRTLLATGSTAPPSLVLFAESAVWCSSSPWATVMKVLEAGEVLCNAEAPEHRLEGGLQGPKEY
ncbi:hypothetical protein GN956_G22822 [Arapaima gigas]